MAAIDTPELGHLRCANFSRLRLYIRILQHGVLDTFGAPEGKGRRQSALPRGSRAVRYLREGVLSRRRRLLDWRVSLLDSRNEETTRRHLVVFESSFGP